MGILSRVPGGPLLVGSVVLIAIALIVVQFHRNRRTAKTKARFSFRRFAEHHQAATAFFAIPDGFFEIEGQHVFESIVEFDHSDVLHGITIKFTTLNNKRVVFAMGTYAQGPMRLSDHPAMISQQLAARFIRAALAQSKQAALSDQARQSISEAEKLLPLLDKDLHP